MKVNIGFLITGFLIPIFLFGILGFSMEKGAADTAKTVGSIDAAGTIESYSGATIPSGYLLCDGRAVSRTTYATLFQAIGTTYGAGDGSTTFNLPNLSERVPVGKSSKYVLGSKGGSATNTLTVANLPAHSHTLSAKGTVSSVFTGSSVTTSSNGSHTHTYSGTTSSAGSHSHTTYHRGYYNMNRTWEGDSFKMSYYEKMTEDAEEKFGYTDTTGAHTHTYSGTTSSSGGHTHTLSAKGTVSSTFTGSRVTTSSTGSGTSFSNMQPYAVMNYIIKY